MCWLRKLSPSISYIVTKYAYDFVISAILKVRTYRIAMVAS